MLAVVFLASVFIHVFVWINETLGDFSKYTTEIILMWQKNRIKAEQLWAVSSFGECLSSPCAMSCEDKVLGDSSTINWYYLPSHSQTSHTAHTNLMLSISDVTTFQHFHKNITKTALNAGQWVQNIGSIFYATCLYLI